MGKRAGRWLVASGSVVLACTGTDGPRARDDEGDIDYAADAIGQQGSALSAPRAVLPPPPMVLSDADAAMFRPLSPRTRAIPVLLFHQICAVACAPSDAYGVSQAELARILLMLRAAGFTTISMAAYEAFARGADPAGLPAQPVLITFDDGRLDAYRGADSVLAALEAKATQFIMTAYPEARASAFMSWSEIAAAQASGRWDIQLHAHAGHATIPTSGLSGAAGRGPYYANLAYDPVAYPTGSHLEPFADWKVRAEADILRGEGLLAARVPGYRPLAFAVPYGNYGQSLSNDPLIAPSLRAFLAGRYGAWFTQPYGNPDFATPNATHEAFRFTVKYGMTAESVYAWLATRSAEPSSDAGADARADGSSAAASADLSRALLGAPPMTLSDADVQRFRPLPARSGAIPVLLFHQICPSTCLSAETYGISQAEFARVMMMTRAAGFTTISAAAYDAFARGDGSALPAQPMLVTFDDGRLDAYRGADAILEALSAKATQFVITANPQANARAFMSWSEIAAAQASGRWDIQLHAHAGHVSIQVGPTSRGSFFGNRRYDPVAFPSEGHLEPFSDWSARVEGDITQGESLLAARVPGYRPLAFALPYGDYGQAGSNDARIAPWLRAFLRERYGAWFTQPYSNPSFTTPNATRELWRYTIKNVSTADSVYTWLASRSPPVPVPVPVPVVPVPVPLADDAGPDTGALAGAGVGDLGAAVDASVVPDARLDADEGLDGGAADVAPDPSAVVDAGGGEPDSGGTDDAG